MNRKNRKIATLITAMLAVGLSIFDMIISVKNLKAYNNLCNTTRDYEVYGNKIEIYILYFFIFLIISIYLIYMIFRYRGRLYDKWFYSYKVIGILNISGEVPGFVHVILKRKGRYYFQECCYKKNDNIGSLRKFKQVKKDLISKIQPLSNFNLNKFHFKSLILGDNALIGFQYDNDKLFIGDIYELAVFLEDYQTEDKDLAQKINLFISDIY